MRKIPFTNGEFYHIYNRGVDKRSIFSDKYDIDRFFQSMTEFNTVEPIGSIYENSFKKSSKLDGDRLVDFICYCLNINHYHFILKQVTDGGISEFMKRLGGGYAWYFNNKYKRSGSLFQGVFKSVYINTNEQLLHTSAYVNLNNHVHQLGGETAKLVNSSWGEYTNGENGNFCNKDIILGQFKEAVEYKKFAEESLVGILNKRCEVEDMGKFLLE